MMTHGKCGRYSLKGNEVCAQVYNKQTKHDNINNDANVNPPPNLLKNVKTNEIMWDHPTVKRPNGEDEIAIHV